VTLYSKKISSNLEITSKPEALYHATSIQNAYKILEFGFDRDMSGQATIQRCRRSGIGLNDEFVIKNEYAPENSVINAAPKIDGCIFGECILKITLIPKVKILDREKFFRDFPGTPRYRMVDWAKRNGYHGIAISGDFWIFGNKSIDKIEIVNEEDVKCAQLKTDEKLQSKTASSTNTNAMSHQTLHPKPVTSCCEICLRRWIDISDLECPICSSA
jgi:hypothetical protein